MTITIGQTYYGPNDERQLVLGVDGGTVQLMHPTTSVLSTKPLEVFETWRLQSDRRVYPPDATGVRRVRRRRYEQDDGQAMVEWVTVDDASAITRDTAEAWQAWRVTLP